MNVDGLGGGDLWNRVHETNERKKERKRFSIYKQVMNNRIEKTERKKRLNLKKYT